MIRLRGMSRDVCDQFEKERVTDDRNNEFFEWMRMIGFVKIDENSVIIVVNAIAKRSGRKRRTLGNPFLSWNGLFQIVYSLLNMILRRNTVY